MKKTPKDPFKNLVLDPEESEIEQALERGEYVSVPKAEFEKTKRLLSEAVKYPAKVYSSKPITIRVNQQDLLKVKAKAAAENIPYQTLIGLLIHQYATGKSSITL